MITDPADSAPTTDDTNPLGEELREARAAAPCALVIFGATGDLTRRKLVPSLMGLAKDGLLPSAFAVVGFARRPWSDQKFRDTMLEGVREHGRSNTAESFEALSESFFYHEADFGEAEGYAGLKRRLEQLDHKLGTKGNRIYYLATPPSVLSLKNSSTPANTCTITK